MNNFNHMMHHFEKNKDFFITNEEELLFIVAV